MKFCHCLHVVRLCAIGTLAKSNSYFVSPFSIFPHTRALSLSALFSSSPGDPQPRSGKRNPCCHLMSKFGGSIARPHASMSFLTSPKPAKRDPSGKPLTSCRWHLTAVGGVQVAISIAWQRLCRIFKASYESLVTRKIARSACLYSDIMAAPRVFIVRHGETEWSLNGRHTGRTDIPLTANGEKRVIATGKALVGDDRLIVPRQLCHVYVSPRKRAQRTFELLNLGISGPLPWHPHGTPVGGGLECTAKVEVTEDIREWDYGDYEGVTSPEIRRMRAEQGLEEAWDIWKDGCPGGESPQDVTDRLDRLIADIRSRFHEPVLRPAEGQQPHKVSGDVLIVAHGHILRAFAMRWAGKTLQEGPAFLLEAGGVGTLSYEHHNIDEPAILLGGAFVVDIAEKGMRP